ncbi:hypothetical protein V7S43_003135 [Phytophthora oleae]|uniref:Uncharacterized protein n=1 Tax=Phytophthora oleae TaxID=2107226 RepID=A0ABD3FWR1_9STRA
MGANPHSTVRNRENRPSSAYFQPRQSQWSSSGPPMDRRRDVVRRPQYDDEGNRVIVDDGREESSRPALKYASSPRDSFTCLDESDRNHVELAPDHVPPPSFPPEVTTDQVIPSDSNMDCEASFSVHDSFLPRFLSTFIMELPSKLEPVMNSTKRSRKMRWYLEYTQRIERICSPHVHIQMESKAVVVLVENRIWLKLKGPSTVILLEKTIRTMRDHAISWRGLKSEVK